MESGNPMSETLRKLFLVISAIASVVGGCAGSLVIRLYFIHGGSRIWLSSFLQTAGFPINLIPLAIIYMIRRKSQNPSNAKLILMEMPLFKASVIIGLLFGVIDYLYSYGSSKLPVSTSALIYSSQLAFVAGFAFFIVKQKFTPYTVNTLVLLTIGPAILALNASSDRPEGESTRDYIKGFIMTGLAALVNGFVLPLMELAYKKANQEITFTLAVEFNMMMCFFATAFSTVGMLINKDFQAISREAREFELGEPIYYLVLVSTSILWTMSLLGLNGVIFCGSSLLSGILSALSIPIVEVLAVIFYHEKFQAQKGISLLLSLWGFVSYFYGEIRASKKASNLATPEVEVGAQEINTQKEIVDTKIEAGTSL
ncbi:hypothetical protein LIER_32885 [Lithospermum erythrorhizon]|uniref:Probable purine permease n=1 Tax=Lithospermum erythrorhizon TaxID=34254 RepID=A0AAV3RZ58_LITER